MVLFIKFNLVFLSTIQLITAYAYVTVLVGIRWPVLRAKSHCALGTQIYVYLLVSPRGPVAGRPVVAVYNHRN